MLAQVLFIILILSSMADRAAKLRKLDDFRRRLPHCTASALSEILADIKVNGIPEGGTSRHRLKDARDKQNSENTHFGPILLCGTLRGQRGAVPGRIYAQLPVVPEIHWFLV